MKTMNIRPCEEPTAGDSQPRVLMQAGRWLVPQRERPAGWRKMGLPVDDAPAPPRDIAPTTNRRDTFKSERRPARKNKPGAGRPRIRPAKAHPHAGRGKAWNRKDSVTDEQILALRAEGLSYAEIGQRLDIHSSTACYRVMAIERKRREAAA